MQAEAAGSAERVSVVAALRNAAAATGSDFHYLLGTAMRESSLKANAQSATSSAAGLFQFVEQTWLGLVKTHGGQYGLGTEAARIRAGRDGRWHVDGDREQILALRKNPQLSALMAGEYAKQTQGQMRAALGRPVCGGELYAAHFLGPDAACRLIRLNETAPGTSAAREFPQAAGANKSVFFNRDGSARSVREIYDWALKQPGGIDTSRLQPANDMTRIHAAATAADLNIQSLMASLLNWQPRGDGGILSLLAGKTDGAPAGMGALGASALSFSPGLLSLLSSSRDS